MGMQIILNEAKDVLNKAEAIYEKLTSKERGSIYFGNGTLDEVLGKLTKMANYGTAILDYEELILLEALLKFERKWI
jgi:hypothetical protein